MLKQTGNRNLKLYIAASMDGYIAGPNGEIDWLEEAGSNLDYGYHDFYSSIDTTVMGNSTYQLILTVEQFPYAGKANYVFTRSAPPPDTANVRFVSGDIVSFRGIVEELARERHMARWRGANQHRHAQCRTHR